MNGKGGLDGESYFADDPELHKWTAATLFISLVVVYKAIFGNLSKEKKEALFKETAVYATSFRMPPEMWPKTLEEFEVYWDDGIKNLPITPWAKTLCYLLIHSFNMPTRLHWSMPLARLLTAHWLPERLRNEYGMKDEKKAYGFWITYIMVVYKMTPYKLRTITHKRYLEDTGDWHMDSAEQGVW